MQQRHVRIARSQHAGDLRCAVIHTCERYAACTAQPMQPSHILWGERSHAQLTRRSERFQCVPVGCVRGRLGCRRSGAGAFRGGHLSFRWVIHSKSCGTSISYPGGRRTVARGCFPDMTPLREKRTVSIRPGELPTVGPLWPCTLARERREQLVSYVASRTHPRRFVLHITDRAALIPLFASCSVPPEYPPLSRYRLNRWSSVVTVSADGKRVRQREILWDSSEGNHGRDRYRTTASVRGKRTGDVATTSEVSQDTSDTAH